MPVNIRIFLLHEVVLEHLQLTGVGQQGLHAEDGHFVVLLGLLLALCEGLFADLKRDAEMKFEGDLLEDGRVAIVFVVKVDIP